jgi:protein ImuA
MQARGVITGRRGALVYLCLSDEVRETGLPYGPGLSGFGIDPGLMVVGRIQKTGDLLWAIEEAAACRAVAAVIADIVRPHRELDFTVSRRLAMRAVASGAAIFMLRYGSDREASAAHLRWHVAPAPSAGLAFDAKAPGAARFAVRLEKGGRRFLGDGAADRWQVEWTHDGLAAQKDSAAGHRDEAALSGIVPAALGDRLSQTA